MFTGLSRSVAIVVAYLIKEQHLTFESAVRLVEAARGKTKMNFGFLKTLQSISKESTDVQRKTNPYRIDLNTASERNPDNDNEDYQNNVAKDNDVEKEVYSSDSKIV